MELNNNSIYEGSLPCTDSIDKKNTCARAMDYYRKLNYKILLLSSSPKLTDVLFLALR